MQDLVAARTEAQQDSEAQLTELSPVCKKTLTNLRVSIYANLLFGFVFCSLFFVFWWLSPSLDLTFQRAAAVLPRLRQWLGFIQLQANELLHALPVLHLGGAVGVILTWLAVRPLRLPHLLVHLGQSQSGGRGPETGSDILASIEVRRPQEMSLWQTGLMEQQSQLFV